MDGYGLEWTVKIEIINVSGVLLNYFGREWTAMEG